MDFSDNIKFFLIELIALTQKNRVKWLPIDYYVNDSSMARTSCYLEIMRILTSKTTKKVFEHECFFAERNGSPIFVLHLLQKSIITNTLDDNYIVYAAPNPNSYLMHFAGLNFKEPIGKEISEKAYDLCMAIKKYWTYWAENSGEGGYGPASSTIMNILAD